MNTLNFNLSQLNCLLYYYQERLKRGDGMVFNEKRGYSSFSLRYLDGLVLSEKFETQNPILCKSIHSKTNNFELYLNELYKTRIKQIIRKINKIGIQDKVKKE